MQIGKIVIKKEIALIIPNITILGECEKSNIKVLCSCNICCNT